jgi:arylsulfatase A-like enzyme
MNILYITVDALRADHVTPSLMPATSEFINQGVEYVRCYANGPGTPWSFPALLGGRYSASTEGFGIPCANDPRPTLAEVLQKKGYVTAGFTDNRFASSEYNYDRGMDSMFDAGATSSDKQLKQIVRERLDHDGILYQSLLKGYHLTDDIIVNLRGRETRFVRAESLISQLKEWIQDQSTEWFAWLHPMDTHAPYEAPDTYQVQYLDEPISRRHSQKIAQKAVHHPEDLNESEWKTQQRLYKSECAYLDDKLGDLFTYISQKVDDNTLIVFTADHGEMHGEHGLGGHPQRFWEEVIHVPCAISAPDNKDTKITGQISLVDLPPTILALAGIDTPTEWVGKNIYPSANVVNPEREFVFIDVGAELNRNLVAVRRADNWKLLRHHEDGELLLDLDSNPIEDPSKDKQENESDVYQSLTNAVDAHLDAMDEDRNKKREAVEDEEMIEEHLKELGYLE